MAIKTELIVNINSNIVKISYMLQVPPIAESVQMTRSATTTERTDTYGAHYKEVKTDTVVRFQCGLETKVIFLVTLLLLLIWNVQGLNNLRVRVMEWIVNWIRK